jgi:NAD(P)-dependent dehydrogenase (short-subunit alcohol dehydrogenase family)
MAQHDRGIIAGRVALVTGASRGIGAATGQALAAAGARVALLARTVGHLEEVASAIQATGGEALALPCDMADPAAVRRALERVTAELGPVDIVINNAAVAWPLGPTAQVDEAHWIEALAINLTGPFVAIRTVLPGMLARRWGRIVNISTGAAIGSGLVSGNAYSVSKAGLEMLAVNLAAELENTGVLAHVVRPGVVETEMQTYVRTRPVAEVGEALVAQFKAMHDQGMLMDPARPARLVLRLLEEATSSEVVDIYTPRGRELLGE